MTEAPWNPLVTDPTCAWAAEQVRAGALGNLLAASASLRVRGPFANPLRTIGLPLFDYLVDAIPGKPELVTAIVAEAEEGSGWSLVVRFDSGLCLSVDLSTGLASPAVAPIDLRIEFSGDERVLMVEPFRLAVTVARQDGVTSREARQSSLGSALLAAEPLDGEAEVAHAIVSAAERSERERVRVPVGQG